MNLAGSDNCQIINTSIINSTIWDIRLYEDSHAFALNCTLDWSNIEYDDSLSNLTVQWFMHVNVTNTSALPISGADIVVKYNASKVIFTGQTNPAGWRRWIVCKEYIENITGKTSILTPHNVSVDHPLYEPGYAEPEPTMNATQVVNIVLKPDVTAPNPPTNLVFNEVGESYLNFSWNASNSCDLEGYNIYINDTGTSTSFHLLNSTTDTYYNATGLEDDTTYYFQVKAYDGYPWESPAISGNSTTIDVTLPAPPTLLTCAKIGGKYIEIYWNASPSADVAGYEVYVNHSGSAVSFYLVTTTTNNFFNHTGLVEETTYYYQVRAYDEVPLLSVFSNVASATTLDITPPAAPTGLVAQDPTGHSITLVWTANSELDIKGYHIYINDTGAGSTGPFHWIGSTTGTSTGYTVGGLQEETTYYFVIGAYDEVPNNSILSDIASATTLDETPPIAPTGLAVSGSTPSSLTISWNANSELDVVGYNLSRSLAMTGPFTIINPSLLIGTSYSDTGLDEDTTYYYKLKAIDYAGLESGFSAIASGATTIGPHDPEINDPVADFSLPEDTYDDTTINLMDWFTDVNDDDLTYRVEGDDHLDVTIYNENGTVTLLPEENWNGIETLTFYAADAGAEVSGVVNITVTAVNDPPETPIIRDPDDKTNINDGGKLNFRGSCDDPDLDYGDSLTYTWYSDVSGEIGVGKNVDDVVLPIGDHIITLEVSDEENENSTASIMVTVQETASSDTDGDTLPNIWERENGLDPDDANDADEDTDADGLTNLEEYDEGTDPQEEDSDGDGLLDGDEVNNIGTDPNRADTDRDGHDDGEDDFPLDADKWQKEKDEAGDDSMMMYIIIIVVIIVIIALVFLFVIRPKMKKVPEEEEEESAPEAQLGMGMTPVPGEVPAIPPEPEYPLEMPFFPPQPPGEVVEEEELAEEELGEEEPFDLKSLAREGAVAYSEGRYDDAIIAWQEVLVHEPGEHPEIEQGIQDAVAKLKSEGLAQEPEDEVEE